MEGATKQRWQELCELAAKEQDPKKLSVLVEEIKCLLVEKERRLNAKRNAARFEESIGRPTINGA